MSTSIGTWAKLSAAIALPAIGKIAKNSSGHTAVSGAHDSGPNVARWTATAINTATSATAVITRVTAAGNRVRSSTGSNKQTRRRLQRTPPRPGGHRVTRLWFLRRFTAV